MKFFLKVFVIFIFMVFLLPLSSIKVYPGWFKHYGGTDGDYCRSIQQTSDGGYILGGITNSYSYGGYDLSIYKLNSIGNKVWFKHYGGSGDDYAESVQQTSDGGYIVAGYTESYTNGSSDFAIYKLNSSGSKVWFKHYGGTNWDRSYTIQQTSDGGYIVAGVSDSYSYGNSDFGIYKLDSSGSKVWFKHYGGSNSDYALSIQQTSDGGYITAGRTESYTNGSVDFAIYKLDSSGNKVWFKHYGGTASDYARSIQQTSEGGYIIAGTTDSYTHGSSDFAIYKLDSSGSKIWFKHYGGTGTERGFSIDQNSDRGYILSGDSTSFTHGCNDYALYRLNSSGSKVWFKHYGGSNGDCGYSTQQTSDGGYIVAGDTNSYTYGGSDFGIYKLNSSGDK